MSNHTNLKRVNQNDFPFEITDVEKTINEELVKEFTGEHTGFIQVGEKKWFFPVKFRDQLATFYNFKVRPTDVWIVTFPKTGTTVTQEMIWLLLNNLDYEEALRIPLGERYPFLEVNCLFHPELHAQLLEENMHSGEKYESVQKLTESICSYLEEMTERRFIKTHLPLSLLPKDLLTSGCKMEHTSKPKPIAICNIYLQFLNTLYKKRWSPSQVIYIARNPKDQAVSYFHQHRSMQIFGFKNDFQKFWEYYSKNLVLWAPYWEHLFEAWVKRNEENLLFLFYENITKDMKKTISDVQNFLGTKFTDEKLDILQDHLKIDNFRKNKSVNFISWKILGILDKDEEPFIRKGKNGEAKKYFDEHLEKEANEWIEQHLKDTDLKFPKY